MNNTTDLIKERLSIVDVVGQYVKLTKAGKNFKGLSPFNKEKTPSFYVSPDRGVYYCFSSGKGGDIFSFIQEMEGLDFRGSLKMLAERAGVELVQESKEAKDERDRQYQILEEATKWFEEQLNLKPDACEYLKKRGLTDESIKHWRLGYAPNEWTKCREFLNAKGYSDHELDKAGLIKRGDKGSWYDRFRGRIMFPIADSAGRIVAYSGRIFEPMRPATQAAGQGPQSGHEPAKYLNSPETSLYDKSRILYGYDKAKQVIRKYDFSIMVEGQMDLVMAHQGGFPNTIAVSGTGLTEHHVTLLERLSKNALMAFDADNAGMRSVHRGAKIALAHGMEVKVVRMPKGVDPADLIKDNIELWRKAVRDSKHVIDFFLDLLVAAYTSDERKLAAQVRKVVLPLVVRIESAIDRSQFVHRVATKLGVPDAAVEDDMVRLSSEVTSGPPDASYEEQREAGTPVTKEPPRLDRLVRTVSGITWWLEESDTDQAALITQAINDIDISLDELLSHDLVRTTRERSLSEKDKLLFETELLISEVEKPDEYMAEIVHDLKTLLAKEEMDAIAIELKRAEAEEDEETVKRLLERSKELAKVVHNVV